MKPIVITALFDVPAGKVWKALSRENELKEWFFPVQNYDFSEGSEFSFYEREYSGKYFHLCRYLRIIPQSLIEYSWAHPVHSSGNSVVCWELEPRGSKTMVTLIHTGIENFIDAGPEFSWNNFEKGWNTIINYNLRNYLYGVKKLCFICEIQAAPDKVWNNLWDLEKYRIWAGEFTRGSYYKGNLKAGNRVHFLAPDGDGMYSDVSECVKNEKIVFRHIGWISGHKEMPLDEETGRWTGNSEKYQLIPHLKGTVLKVEVEAAREHRDFYNRTLPKALEKLSELCKTTI